LFFDTHTHLMASEFDDDRDDVIKRAMDVGVNRMIAVGFDLKSSIEAVRLAEKYEMIYASVGIHPCYVHLASETDYKKIESLFNHPAVVAVGETGIDLYHDNSTYPLQEKLFCRHLEWGRDTGLPVIIHDRNAHAEVMEKIVKYSDNEITTVLHCFTGDITMARKALAYGSFLGFGGVTTYKNSIAKTILPSLPQDRILVETDAPYLPPVPHRGRRNEPAYLLRTAEAVANYRSMSVIDLARTTTENAKRVFQIL